MLKQKLRYQYGWVIVLLGALALFFSSPGQTYSVSIFADAYIETMGYSRTLIAGFYSTATLISGFSMPFIGRMVDQKGYRASLLFVGVMLALTTFWMMMLNQPWMIFIGFLFLRMFGQGSLTLIPSVLIPQWFLKKRGRALSLITVGGILGSSLVPPLNQKMIETFGISLSWLFWGLLLLLVFVPLVYVFAVNQPEEIGMAPDGEELYQHQNTTHAIEDESFTVKQATKTYQFWLLLYCMMVPALVTTGITFHMLSLVASKGLPRGDGAMLLGLTAISQLPFNFVAGFLSEKFKIHHFKALNYLILALAVFILIISTSLFGLIIYSVILGVFVGFEGVSTSVMWANFYGRKHLGKIRGISTMAMVIGSALGPLPFGLFYQWQNTYTMILWIILFLPLIASLFSLISPQPKLSQSKF